MYLSKVSISNARRFGKDVEFELSKGANIILAPNGTGKTTLFEAIEFALTGAIKRLQPPPTTFIRDKQKEISVRLDFSNNKYCEVNLRNGKEPIISGDHSVLYPNHKIDEVAYLLRLTHLLEQRGNEWFVQKADPAAAGNLLDKLSLGKDITSILKTKTPTLRASTKEIGRVTEEYKRFKDSYTEFNNKLRERDLAKIDYDLEPLDSLFSKISVINKSFEEQVQTGDKITLETLKPLCSQMKKVLSNRIQKLLNEQGRLSLISNKIDDFNKNIELLKERKERVKKNQQLKIEVDEKIKNLVQEKEKNTDIINKRKDEVEKLKTLQSLIDKESSLTKTLSEKKIKNQELKKTLAELENNIKELNKELTEKKTLIEGYKSIDARENTLQKSINNLTHLNSIIKEWEELQQKLKILEGKVIPELKAQIEKSTTSIKSLKNEQEVIIKKESEQRAKLNSLKKVSNEIHQALSIISTNIAKDQKNCPVCSATYEPDELRKRIDNALKDVDPLLQKEILKGSEYERSLGLKRNQLKKAEENLKDLETSLKVHQREVSLGQITISNEYKPKFNNVDSLNEAIVWRKKEIGKLQSELKNFSKQKNDIGIDQLKERVSELELSIKSLKLECEINQDSKQELTIQIKKIEAELERITKQKGGRDIDKLKLDLRQLDNTLIELSEKNKEKTNKINVEERKLIEVNKEIKSDLNFMSDLESFQNKTSTEWKDLKIEGQPSFDLYDAKNESLKKERDLSEDYIKSLDKIEEELARWESASNYLNLDREIKGIQKELSLEEYIEEQNKKEKKLKADLENKKRIKKALNQLYEQLGAEVDNVHKQIISINPLWVSLLKKIVVNPRFSETKLDSHSYRNKPQAEVNVKLHGSNVKVMDVASEAQATDLQLTFMLAMATTYKWTPWKALLLDDPTQHHDLVHAAGVFDLLRDYIIDHDFQILLGTHDTVQARFFQRKLQNDNVPVSLWQLTTNNQGVTAKII